MSKIRCVLLLLFCLLTVILFLFSVSSEDSHVHEYGTPVPYSAFQHCSECVICGKTVYSSHIFGDWTTVLEPSENEIGLRVCTCTVCGAVHSEAIGTLITEESEHEHTFSEWAQYSAFQHYRVCSCGAIDFGEHVSVGDLLIDIEADSLSFSLGHYKCTQCNGLYGQAVVATSAAEKPSDSDADARLLFDNPFSDVSENDPYYDAVAYVVTHGLFNGVSATAFEPAIPMTRGMFVTVLSRVGIANLNEYTDSFFTDVQIDIWYGHAVQWAASLDLVQGYEDGTFRPDNALTIEQSLVILRRYAEFLGLSTVSEYPLDAYSDAEKVSDWALGSVRWAIERSIYTGSEGMILPQSSATRAQVAEMLYTFAARFMKR